MGLRCFTRKRKDGSNYVNCIEINEGQRAIGNNLIPIQEQARGLGNNLLALGAPPPLMIGGNIQQPPPMDNEVASNIKDEILRNMRNRGKRIDSSTESELDTDGEAEMEELIRENAEKKAEMERLMRELEM